MKHHRGHAWLAVGLLCVLMSTGAGAQQSGTMLRQTLTLLRGAADVSMGFEVGPVSAGTATELWVEIGQEGATAVPPADPGLPNSVVFTLTNVTTGVSHDLVPDGPADSVTFANKLITFTRGHGDPTNQKGLYVLDIAHITGVANASKEDWTLKVVSLPVGLRAMSSINQAFFTSLTPAGAQQCTTPPPPMCPAGQTCKGPCATVVPWWRYLQYVLVAVQWPFPPPPCGDCPIPWEGPILEGFDRAIISVTPSLRDSMLLGPGHAEDVKMSIRGAEAVGPVVDAGGGQYLQMITFRKGESPHVTATVGDITSGELVVGARGDQSARLYQVLTYVLALLLVLALAAAYYLGSRRTTGTAGR